MSATPNPSGDTPSPTPAADQQSLPTIDWESVPEYTQRLVQCLTDNPEIREGLFGDIDAATNKSNESNEVCDSSEGEGDSESLNTDPEEEELSESELAELEYRRRKLERETKMIAAYNPLVTGICNGTPGYDHAGDVEKTLAAKVIYRRMVFSQVLSSPKDSSAGKRKAPGQQEVVVRKKARYNDQVERLRKQEESLQKIMMIHMEGSLERMNIRLETERLKLRSQESRQEYELEEMKQREQEMEKSKQESEKSHQEFLKKQHEDRQSLARKKAKFDSAMLRYPLLLSDGSKGGNKGRHHRYQTGTDGDSDV